ncbi:MAG: deoxyribose-phosphate aldolase, partial [Clostridiales Family XIII bacterium]|nr:deoxyribose-phosphate aldolase [Clostridiales Family XIII bacterium]
MNKKTVAKLIDISAVRSFSTREDIIETCSIAKKYGFINVHSLPSWTLFLSELLYDRPDIKVGAPVGFPTGGNRKEVKILEAKKLIDDGVEEMDIVMNIGKFKSGEKAYVLDEINEIISIKKSKDILTKVIIEINALSDKEILSAAELIMKTKADYIKTGTGYIVGDTNIERIRLIKEKTRNKIKIKAAGGIRTKKDFEELLNLGIERFGINTKS